MNYLEIITNLMFAITNTYGVDEADFPFWERTFMSPINYVNAVVKSRVLATVYKQEYEGDIYRQAMSSLSFDKMVTWDALCASFNIINRQCERLGLPGLPITTENPSELAEYAGQIVGEIYFGEEAMSLYSATESRNEEYDTNELSRKLKVSLKLEV